MDLARSPWYDLFASRRSALTADSSSWARSSLSRVWASAVSKFWTCCCNWCTCCCAADSRGWASCWALAALVWLRRSFWMRLATARAENSMTLVTPEAVSVDAKALAPS
ncbi:hypothetical protein BCR44DRAFT_168778 [Catenaria anguillulae PL171]|uniref:Uncharacterized protein n=1 Tax=Catenaria anguillulae PL171 TaxID=765915 RepID=A0A1Y2HIR5_9FUNG|nr:hypothetical protein BCR44DRAFT_168778 [Catenaria anguillulae PL171]